MVNSSVSGTGSRSQADPSDDAILKYVFPGGTCHKRQALGPES